MGTENWELETGNWELLCGGGGGGLMRGLNINHIAGGNQNWSKGGIHSLLRSLASKKYELIR